jgi:hypothetical protein
MSIAERWQVAAAVATIVQAIGLLVSLIFIWRQVQLQTIQANEQTKQIKDQTRLAKSSNAQSLVALSSPFNLELIKDDKIAGFWVKGDKEYETFDIVRKYQYESLLLWWLITLETKIIDVLRVY